MILHVFTCFLPDALRMRCRLLTPEEQRALAPEWVMTFDSPAKRCWFDPEHGLGHQGTADLTLSDSKGKE